MIQSMARQFAADVIIPQAAEYDGSNANHAEFMISATNLFASMLKLHPAKHPSEQNDELGKWQAEYRTHEWINGVVAAMDFRPPSIYRT